MKKIILVFIGFLLFKSSFAQQAHEIMYVGTYAERGSEGIYVYGFERDKGILHPLQTVNTLASPTFLAIHPSGNYMYSVNRAPVDDSHKNSGSVSAYAIDKTGRLTLLNHKPSFGMGPCHISIDQTGMQAFISNYVAGNLLVFSINGDGSLGGLLDSVRFSGKSSHPERQTKPYIHSATLSPDNRFVMVADLGTDRIYSYALSSTGKITPAQKPFVEVKPGSGPRHFTFHPNGQYAYVVEELTSTVCVLRYDQKTGALEVIEDNVKALPDTFTGTNTSADIHTDSKGKYLFMSNRGNESLSIFSIAANGKMIVSTITYKQFLFGIFVFNQPPRSGLTLTNL